MLITYLRSSSFARYDFCPMAYFIEYNLGTKGPSNQKADTGTIIHRILEILGQCKLAKQNNKRSINDKIIGKVSTHSHDVNKIIQDIYRYYVLHMNHHIWTDKHFTTVKKLVWKCLLLNDGMFDPRKRKIVALEKKFDFILDYPWASYKYKQNEEILSGNLGLKGTIDNICEIDSETLECVDYKTGKRKDWATGKEKTFESLMDDFQLRLYHYALSKLYPQYKTYIMTIFYIADGGPFSLPFNEKSLIETESIVRRRFQQIKSNHKPRQNRTWKCKKLCHYGMCSFDNPPIEYRPIQLSKPGEDMPICSQIQDYMEKYKISKTIEKFKNTDWNISDYYEPGSV